MSHPSADRITALYERNAAAWASQRGDELTEGSLLELFVERLVPGAWVLDVGCGSGRPVARCLLKHGFQITGLDSSPSLIELARRDFPGSEWIIGHMRALDLRRTFDGIIAWYSLFHLTPEDQRPMFARFADHCTHGGILFFVTGPRHGDAIGEWQGEPLYHGSLDPAEYRQCLESNGFQLLIERPHEPERGQGVTWLARYTG